MTRERAVLQRPQRSPLCPSNTGGGCATADAVGSSTKDHAWQQRVKPAHGGSGHRNTPPSDKKKKKVEGVIAPGGDRGSSGPWLGASASRIPSRSHMPAPAGPTPQQHRQAATPATAGSSRIPRPPTHGAGASPEPSLVGMLATPAAAPQLLPELHTGAGRLPAWSLSPDTNAASQAPAAAPAGFQAYGNPSFDGAAHFLADTPGAAEPAGCSSSASMYVNRLAMQPEEAGAPQLNPGLLEPAALTPNSERSLQAWLGSSPGSAPAASWSQLPGAHLRASATAAPASSAVASASRTVAHSGAAAPLSSAPSSSANASAASRGRALPTPEAWHMLQHINDDSPAAAPKGVRGIMNAYLRTGPQALSPEPPGAGTMGVIPAPGATAVPASGLLNVAGPGGAGVMGMMNAYLRTSAAMLSPEPGMEGQGGAASGAQTAGPRVQPAPLLHPYSPVSPLAATPGPVAAGGTHADLPQSVGSVCSNGACGSTSPSVASPGRSSMPPSVPRLNLSGILQQQQAKDGGTDGTEISFGAALAAVGLAGSPEDSELPTARLSPAVDEQPRMAPLAGVTAEDAHAAPPSPVTFCLPGDPTPRHAKAGAAAAADGGQGSNSPSFSFGFGHVQAATAAPEPCGPAQAPDVADDPAPAAGLQRCNNSGETVQQQPTLYNAMLDHLRGPQYASPARFALPPTADSPQSPQQCTPLHLISTSDGPSPLRSGGSIITPAPGQGSLTVWMDRRGMRGALNTPARNDLRLLWAAARDVKAVQSEAAALHADNVALLGELDAAQQALRELGAEREAAVVAAEAGALCAEAEMARARQAAGHMMALADQIQGMFALCENEKEALVQELATAQAQLASSEAAAADTAHLSEQQRAELQAQLEETRQAAAAAQAAANMAEQRAGQASDELDAIRRQLAEAQAQLAEAQAAQEAEQQGPADTPQEQQQQEQQAAVLTPLAKLRGQLSGVHDSLAQLHAEHQTGRLHARTPELDKLWEASRAQLARIESLLGADPEALRAERGQLQACLDRAHTLLAKHTPATVTVGKAGPPASSGRREGSPVPFALFRQLSDGEGGADGTPSSAGAPSPDVFSSPFLADSQTTLTVDYRTLHADLHSGWRQQSGTPASVGSSVHNSSAAVACSPSDASSQGSASPDAAEAGQAAGAGDALGELQRQEGQEGGWEAAPAAAGAEREYTVVHNGMIITNVPASEVSKVRSMVQYWEAVASGTPLVEAAAAAGVSAEEAAAAEAYASAAVAAAEVAIAARELAAAEAAVQAAREQATAQAAAEPADASEANAEGNCVADEEAAAAEDWAVVMARGLAQELEAMQLQPASQDAACPAPAPAEPSPALSPTTFTPQLPAGEAATPCGLPTAMAPRAAAPTASTPARTTPLNFASAPPPTPAEGIDPQQAQPLHSLAVSMAAAVAACAGAGVAVASPAATPVSAIRTASRLPATPVGTPLSLGTPAGTPASSRAAAAALAVTPLALSALRARMGGSGGGAAQDAVRSRLARLKADLQAAQAKLATVDQGLASIAFTPSTVGGTPGSRDSSMQRGRGQATPSTGGAAALGSPITLASSGSPSFRSSALAAARIAAGGLSPPPPAAAPPDARIQALHQRGAAPPPAEQRTPAPPQTGQASVSRAAPSAELTPAATRRSVRFASDVVPASSGRGALRVGTPYSAAVAELESSQEAEGEGKDGAVAQPPGSASPVVASCPRGPQGLALAGVSPAGAAAAQARRSPLAPMQSAAKPAAGGAPLRRFALGRSGDDGGSSSDDESELLFDASRMAQQAKHLPSPSPLRRPPAADGATPMAHPERSGRAAAQEMQLMGSHAKGARSGVGGPAATPGTSVLSTSSFSPPQPLVLLAVRPLGRARRGPGGMLRGGRLRGEAEEKEFRRRAAALNIQVSPYFKRSNTNPNSR